MIIELARKLRRSLRFSSRGFLRLFVARNPCSSAICGLNSFGCGFPLCVLSRLCGLMATFVENVHTKRGESTNCTFTVHVRTPKTDADREVRLKPRELGPPLVL